MKHVKKNPQPQKFRISNSFRKSFIFALVFGLSISSSQAQFLDGLELMKQDIIVIANIVFIVTSFLVVCAAIWNAGFQLIKWKGYAIGLLLVFAIWGSFHMAKDQIFSYWGGSQILTETGGN